jgi:chromosome segregation ATPase
VTKALKM